MKQNRLLLMLLGVTILGLLGPLSLNPVGAVAQGPTASPGTGFTYQGQLKDGAGQPLTATCDLRFTLWDAASAGTQIGSESLAGVTSVVNGYFTALVNTGGEFGATAFNGQARWLEVGVRCPSGSGTYTPIAPRQALTPAPYAGYALAAPWAGLTGIPSGFADGSDNTGSDWHLGGNTGTSATTDFLGTSDNVALTLRVNNLPALRLVPDATSPNLIGGYSGNSVAAGIHGATIGGGGSSGAINNVTEDYGTVGGGYQNTTSGNGATVGGGYGNTASGGYATVGGGYDNTANGNYAIVGNGYQNTASGGGTIVSGGGLNIASGSYATVAGGYDNTASGAYATVGGGYGNVAAGEYSFVAGRQAANEDVNHKGVFLFADSSYADFSSTAANQFRVRATGGVQFVTAITAGGGASAGVQVAAGGGSWSAISDRNLKANFAPVDGRAVLAAVAEMPISTWNYTAQDEAIRHIGPMAQDFYAAFGVGEDDTHITTIDADGVALAAIQGLNGLVAEKDAQIAELEARLAALERGEVTASPWPWLALSITILGCVFIFRKA